MGKPAPGCSGDLGGEPGEPIDVEIVGCVDVANCDGEPLAVTVEGFEFTGDVNVSPDGPVAVPICIDGTPGILFGQCNDGVGSWKAYDDGSGVTPGLPASFTFGECPGAPISIPLCYESTTWQPWVDNHSNPDRPPGPAVRPGRTYEIDVCWSDGSTHTGSIPSSPGWGPVNDNLAIAINAGCPDQTWIGPSGDAGDNNPRASDGDPSTPYGAYAHGVEVCPGEKVPTKATAYQTDAKGNRIGSPIPLAVGLIEGDVETFWFCKSCGEAGEWQDADGNVLAEEPPCAFPCGTLPEMPPAEEPTCSVDTVGPICEISPEDYSDPDNEIDAAIVTSDVFLSFINCDGDISVEAYTIDINGDPVEHILTDPNYYGDCDTLEPIDAPEPECPADCVWNKVNYEIHAAAIDNNNWDSIGNPYGLVRPSWDATIEITLANGDTVVINQVGSANAYTQLAQWVAAFEETGNYCSVRTACDNWSRCNRSPNGPAPAVLAWPRDVAFGNYLYVQSCDPSVLPVSGEVLAASGPQNSAAGVGATKDDFGTKTVSGLIGYECVDCNGKYFMDCDGNITEPECCCSDAPAPVTFPENMITPCDCDDACAELAEILGETCIQCDKDSLLVTVCNLPFVDCGEAGTEATCAFGGNLANNTIFEGEESGIKFTLCGVDYQFAPGSYTLAEVQAFLVANSPHDVQIVPTGADFSDFVISLPCDCLPSPTFTIGDDDPVDIQPFPEYNADAMPGAEQDAILVKICDDTEPEPDILECAISTCADDCEFGSTYIFGRPPAGQPWKWGPYSGNNLNEFEAALTAAGYTVIQIGEKHQICPPFGAFGEDPDAPLGNSIGTYVPSVEPNIDPNYVPSGDDCALTVNVCNQPDPIELPTTPCLFCTILPFDRNSQFDNPIVEYIGGAGAPVPVANSPFATIEEFAYALEQLGYQVSIDLVASTFEVCGGPDVVTAYVLDDGTIVDAIGQDSKDGLLVCSPGFGDLSAKLDALLSATQTGNDILSALFDCLCNCTSDEDPCDVTPVLTNADDSAFVPIGDAGPNADFPLPALNDSAILSPEFKVFAPFPACAAGMVTVRISWDHETCGGNYDGTPSGHNGFFVNTSAGMWVSGSETNGITVNSGTGILIKQAGTTPFGCDRSIRTVDLVASPADLAAGIILSSFAFGSVGVGGEILHDITVEITDTSALDCSGCEAGAVTGNGCLGQLRGFDYQDHATWTAGDPMDWTVNGTPVSIDVATLPAGANKSTWYAPLWALLPAGYTVTVVSDAAPTSSDKPVFEFSYSGPLPAPAVLINRLTGTNDSILISVDAAGNGLLDFVDTGSGESITSNESLKDCDGVGLADGPIASTLNVKSS